MLANSNEPSATDNAAEQSSPYAVIPHIEKLAKLTQSAISSQGLASLSPYASQSKQLEPPPPDAEKLLKPTQSAISSQELVSQSPYAFQSKQLEPPPPEPPSAMPEWPAAPTRVADLKPVPQLPPEPQPAPVAKVSDSPDKASEPSQDSGSFSPYAEILGQAPRALSNIRPERALVSEPASPYAASLHQAAIVTPTKKHATNGDSRLPALTQPRSPLTYSGSALSPYSTISTQPITTSASKVSAGKLETASPYAPSAAEPRTPMMAIGPDPTSTFPVSKNESDAPVLQAKLPEQPEMHLIGEAPAPSQPQVDVDLASDSNSDPLIARKTGEPPWLTALRCFASKRPTEAIAWLKRYDEPNQELLLRISPLIVRIAAAELTRNDAEKGAELIDSLSNLLAIPVEGDLVIGKLCLCKHIKTFGDYEPFPEDHPFQPRDLVWIYAEVRNFSSARRDLGNGELVYETQLKTTARITNDAGTRKWPLQFDRRCETDRSRSLRRDYWDNLSFNVPDLPPGGYTLWLKVVDEPTGRFKERTVDFQVVPPQGLLQN
jgi:hypothetical protein